MQRKSTFVSSISVSYAWTGPNKNNELNLKLKWVTIFLSVTYQDATCFFELDYTIVDYNRNFLKCLNFDVNSFRENSKKLWRQHFSFS